jgi:class 3 adenylate cyclase
MTASGTSLVLALFMGIALVIWSLHRWVKPYLDEAVAVRLSLINGQPYEPPERRSAAISHRTWVRRLFRLGRAAALLLPVLPFAMLADPRVWLREALNDCAEARGATLRLLVIASHVFGGPSRIWVVWSGRLRAGVVRLSPRIRLDGHLVYRLVLVTDIEAYTRRNAEEQRSAQNELCGVLDVAAERARFGRHRWDRQVTGDGELSVLPHDVDIARFIGAFSREMASALAEVNGVRPAPQRLRVRLALHHGTLTAGPLGAAGDAPVVASRLVNVDAGRQFLRERPEDDIALIVSASLYQEVISTGFCTMDPADFAAFQIVVKGTPYSGYLYQGQLGNLPDQTPSRTTGSHLGWAPDWPVHRA